MTTDVVAADLYTLEIRDEADVFASRHAGREVATAVGLDTQDVVRLATALSEVGRDVLAAGGGTVKFRIPSPDRLEVTLTSPAELAAPRCTGIDAARRLLDHVALRNDETGAVVVLEKQVPAGHTLSPARRRDLEFRLSRMGRSSLDELRTQNRELVAALEEVQSRRDELERVNAELEETNRGVLALYAELSGELETTNQGVVALYAEIDDNRRQLRAASESKTRFLNNISHELRTPGNSVLGLARLLLDARADPLTDEQRQQVEFISTSAEDLLRLVNELLDLAKAESGRLEARVDAVDLGRLFDELRGTTAPLVTRPEVELVVEAPLGLDGFRSDATLLGHLLRNLLSNAVKFTETGQVVLRAERVARSGGTRPAGDDPGAGAGDTVRLSVRDTGVGIAEEDQAQVFEEFFQVRGHVQAGVKGTGLGLSFARRIAVILGGDLELVSAPGVGTTFTVELPVGGPSDSTDPETDPEPDPEGPGR